jgi:hypothetical protein
MVRCQMNFKRLSLTDFKIDIKRVPKKLVINYSFNHLLNQWCSVF